jgi:CubicO group peptidase (beta-lactamase class C family)
VGCLEAIDDWDVETVAAAVFDTGSVLERRGDVERRFPLASVSKVLSAVTVLVAVEEGSVDLDDPTGPEGSTVRHLLAHASGLGPEGQVLAAPGTRRIYSNAGFEALATHVSAGTGIAFGDYASGALVEPLDLTSTDVTGSAAHGHVSSALDVCAVVQAVVSERLLAGPTVEEMTSPVFAELAGVLPGYGQQAPNTWGLGVEIRGGKSPHWTAGTNSPRTWGHFGQSGTFIWFDPVAGVGLAVLTDRDFGAWAVEAWPELSAAVLEDQT